MHARIIHFYKDLVQKLLKASSGGRAGCVRWVRRSGRCGRGLILLGVCIPDYDKIGVIMLIFPFDNRIMTEFRYL